MKHLIWIATLLFTLSACSKEEQPQAVADDTTAVEAPAPDVSAEEVTEATEETADDTLEVVEESASEEEPKDEAIVLTGFTCLLIDRPDLPVHSLNLGKGFGQRCGSATILICGYVVLKVNLQHLAHRA